MQAPSGVLEWLSTNRLGSFALGSVDRRLRRKYHALLTVREPGRGDAWNVLAEVHERVERDGQALLLADTLRGLERAAELSEFSYAPNPTHRYRALGLDIERRLALSPEHDQVELTYRVRGVESPVRLSLAPLLRCRPVHELSRENPFLDGSLTPAGEELRMTPYAGMPPIAFRVERLERRLLEGGTWHRDVHYPIESERGYSAHEDVFSPGEFVFELARDAEFTLVVALGHTVARVEAPKTPAPRSFAAKLELASEQFFMRTKRGTSTVVAGYPWFGPWGRDTLIALPGLHLATRDFERTAAVLDGMLDARINGLVPNIPALGDLPASTSSVDATLLFVRAVQWLADVEGEAKLARFMPSVCELLEALIDARDARMRFDDGVGVRTEPGPWALTWMDAMVDGTPVTPRAGYAIDVDALAYNGARFALDWAEAHKGTFARALRTRLRDAEARFLARYWDDTRGYLADAHDGMHADFSLRPNQLWALALPFSPVPAPAARASLHAVTDELLTPAGLRTLSPRDPHYVPRYEGPQRERDRAYHQGTVWPWLLGVYADAVRAVRGRGALEGLLSPVLSFHAHHLDHEGCIGQVSEIFDGNAPHTPSGTPAQAWSVAELYRVWCMLHSSD